MDIDIGKSREDERHGKHNHPHKATVHNKGDTDTAARTDRKIRAVVEGIKRHINARNDHHIGRKRFNAVLGVVKLRENARAEGQQRAERNSAEHRADENLAVCVLRFRKFALTQKTADHYRNDRAERHINDRKDVKDRRADVLRRDDVDSARCIALISERKRYRPEKFVCH